MLSESANLSETPRQLRGTESRCVRRLAAVRKAHEPQLVLIVLAWNGHGIELCYMQLQLVPQDQRNKY